MPQPNASRSKHEASAAFAHSWIVDLKRWEVRITEQICLPVLANCVAHRSELPSGGGWADVDSLTGPRRSAARDLRTVGFALHCSKPPAVGSKECEKCVEGKPVSAKVICVPLCRFNQWNSYVTGQRASCLPQMHRKCGRSERDNGKRIHGMRLILPTLNSTCRTRPNQSQPLHVRASRKVGRRAARSRLESLPCTRR